MLRLLLHMEFASGSVDEAAGVLRSLAGPVRSEPGCTATQLVRDADSLCTLTWVEEWRSVEAFQRHLRAMAFRRILSVMELAVREPEVEIDHVSSRRGFEFVEEILGKERTQRGMGVESIDAPAK